MRTTVNALATRALALMTTLTLLVATFLTLSGTVAPPASADSATEAAFVAKIYTERHSRHLRGLTVRSDLVLVARGHSAKMARANRLYHNPYLTTQVKNWRWVGENVGVGPSVDALHKAFMASPGHRANILDTDYTEVGIGTVVVGGKMWVTEVFRTPMNTTTTEAVDPLDPFNAVTYGSGVQIPLGPSLRQRQGSPRASFAEVRMRRGV